MNRRLFGQLPKPVKGLLKGVARQTIGRFPASPTRLTGTLAMYGGAPVRDTRLRPWASVNEGNFRRWPRMRNTFRRIYRQGIEGLPQPLAEQFAQQWAHYCGCRFGLLLGHGTDALRFGLAAALDHDGLEYGGEVIVPNYSFIATATAALDRRFGVAFVDVDPATLLLDPARVEEAIVPGKTRALLPVHLFGQPANMNALKAIADKHDLKIVEDAAQAHGAVWETGPVGSLGHAAGFSFQSSKNLASGEGGALTTNDEALFERAYSMQNAGRSRSKAGRWEHVALGWNCRITEYQAGLLIHRFSEFNRQQAVRHGNFRYLRTLMSNLACLEPLALHPGVRAHGMYMFAMRYDQEHCGGYPIESFLELVRAEGIPIDRSFASTISDQPAIRNLVGKRPEYFRRLPTPVADQAVSSIVYLPQNVFLGSSKDMEDIVAAIHKVERHCGHNNVRTRATSRTDVVLAELAS
jgi:dTDP-4-amino-4,6-dideoxygalactose transaminase